MLRLQSMKAKLVTAATEQLSGSVELWTTQLFHNSCCEVSFWRFSLFCVSLSTCSKEMLFAELSVESCRVDILPLNRTFQIRWDFKQDSVYLSGGNWWGGIFIAKNAPRILPRDGEQLKSLRGVGQEKQRQQLLPALGMEKLCRRSCWPGWPVSSCQPSPRWSSVGSPGIPIRIHLRLHSKPSFGINRPILNGFIWFQRGRIFLFPGRSKLKFNSRMQAVNGNVEWLHSFRACAVDVDANA